MRFSKKWKLFKRSNVPKIETISFQNSYTTLLKSIMVKKWVKKHIGWEARVTCKEREYHGLLKGTTNTALIIGDYEIPFTEIAEILSTK